MIPPTRSDPPGQPRQRDWIDAAIESTSGLAAVAMFAYGVALSYAVLYAIAEAAGLPEWARRLWPAGWELFMASAALNALAEQRHLRGQHGFRRVPWYPLALTGLTAGGSILLNWFHPAIPLDPPPGWLVSLVYGLPPLEAVLAWHLFLLRIAHRRHPAPVPASTVPVPFPQRAVPEADRRDGPAATTAGRTQHQAGDRPGGTPPSPATRPTVGTASAKDRELLARARAAAAEHQRTRGRPISRDALRQALRVSNRTAGALLRELRAGGPVADGQPEQAGLDRPPIDQAGGVAVGADQPSSEMAPAAVAGNGATGRPADLTALVPVPESFEEGARDA